MDNKLKQLILPVVQNIHCLKMEIVSFLNSSNNNNKVLLENSIF